LAELHTCHGFHGKKWLKFLRMEEKGLGIAYYVAKYLGIMHDIRRNRFQ
jgi:ribosomal protein L13E